MAAPRIEGTKTVSVTVSGSVHRVTCPAGFTAAELVGLVTTHRLDGADGMCLVRVAGGTELDPGTVVDDGARLALRPVGRD